MAKISEMTQLSPTMSEGVLVKWLKKKGDSVAPGEILAEVETDKAVMEMEAFDSGVILEILAQEGAKLPVGAPVAIIGKAGEDITSLLSEAKSRSSASVASPPASAPASTSVPSPSPSQAPKKTETVASSTTPKLEEEEVSPPKESPVSRGLSPSALEGRVKASPLAKRLAQESGIDLSKIRGSGPDGRIIKRDIENGISAFSSSGISPFAGEIVQEEKLPISGMRKTIASRLVHSKTHQPHFYLDMEIDADALVHIRENFNSDLKESGEEIKLSINDFIIRASALALLKVPEVNSSWREDHILKHGRVDIGVAVSIEGGLITPYVRNADKRSVLEIGRTVKELASRARERKLKPEEFSDGTFTVSNLGMFGVNRFAAVINEPEAAILAVGNVVSKPVIKNGSIVPGKTLSVCLSCDHRVVDGAVGAGWLEVFRNFLEHPLRLLA
ncbi:pyruvate dehydrogenase complex dihydrolipoamide acetyltransferase [Leptospira selangorensis]|uniref:Acetyltransferase component of pyruvate dehydrogenase complex n=1 Tax=Leptospira selangorensis TaxID=2484982 RepID=A0A5F2C2S6_9LEPT|nr:pyruvate dehydrogenase complex dihydrolipoamide acetyltransferase [Leptospira selangorensis]TGM11387.1 pyruvate dehydrogenase complex dihydrolipoamide acetyltransferase [Leptospira selangorensis]TGM21036.1 pyruvate dehydrogenase complex dihydrolipoamide acetyltransferase [Leptospira selangorensis]